MELRHTGKKGMRWGHRKARVPEQNQVPNKMSAAFKVEARRRSIRKIEDDKNSFANKVIVLNHYLNYGTKSTNKLLERMDAKNLTADEARKAQMRSEQLKATGAVVAIGLLGTIGTIGAVALQKHIEGRMW